MRGTKPSGEGALPYSPYTVDLEEHELWGKAYWFQQTHLWKVQPRSWYRRQESVNCLYFFARFSCEPEIILKNCLLIRQMEVSYTCQSQLPSGCAILHS